MTKINLLVFVPIEEPDLILCQESDFPKLRKRVNEILNNWVLDFGIETIKVKGTLLSRLDQVLNKISEIKIQTCYNMPAAEQCGGNPWAGIHQTGKR
jgi:hypothetical protein